MSKLRVLKTAKLKLPNAGYETPLNLFAVFPVIVKLHQEALFGDCATKINNYPSGKQRIFNGEPKKGSHSKNQLVSFAAY